MSESAFWKHVKEALFGWDPVRVETPYKDGIPDVNHIHGWIELKVAKWPVRPITPVGFKKYYQQQRVWHKRRCHAGGLCHLLVRINKDVLLFRADVAADICGKLPQEELIRRAVRYWPSGEKWKKELKNAIFEDIQ